MSVSETLPPPTRDRILVAASDVFAQEGFEKATVRGICARAKANVAAVNYHFRDKRELYRMVLQAWQAEAEARFPLDGGLAAPDAPVVERLRGFYRAMLLRLFRGASDPQAAYGRARVWLGELIQAGLAQSPESMRNYSTMEAHLRPLVQAELGPVEGTRLRDAVDSCLAQVVIYFLGFVSDPGFFSLARASDDEIDRVAAHMTHFALGGLRAMKENGNDDL